MCSGKDPTGYTNTARQTPTKTWAGKAFIPVNVEVFVVVVDVVDVGNGVVEAVDVVEVVDDVIVVVSVAVLGKVSVDVAAIIVWAIIIYFMISNL